MRTRTPHSLSVLASRGRMNVDSDRFISLASDCISLSVNPRPSENTAKELPASGREEKTSHCVIASRRDGWLINRPGEPVGRLKVARAEMTAEARAMQEISPKSICAVNTMRAGFYSYWVICLTHRGFACCCMFMPSCG